MNKVVLILSLMLSILAIIIGVISLCLSFPRTYDLGFDYQGVIVGVLSLLVTVLLGWNIYTFLDLRNDLEKYKNESNKKMSIIDSLEKDIEEDRFRNKYALDANISLMQGEFYLSNGYYLIAYREYISSIVRFNASGDMDLYEQILQKIGTCIRNIDKEIRNIGYVIDWDFDNDVYHNNNIARISENRHSFPNIDILEKERIIKHFIIKSDCISVSGLLFKIYRQNTEIKKKSVAIYALFKCDNGIYKHFGRVFGDYNLFVDDIMKDLKSDYDLIGVCEIFNGDIKEVLTAIKSEETCKYVKNVKNNRI